MSRNARCTGQHWSEHTERFSGRNAGLFWWEAGPEIQRHINRKISGSPNIDWIAYALSKYYRSRLPLGRCLSLGCGDGHLERSLARLGAFEYCDAYDVAEGSLQVARKLAEDEGLQNISYHVADINRIALPTHVYDAVWIHQAMHHFEALEHVCQQINRSLKSEGLLILNEYVGPSRFQFPSRQRETANLCLQLLPAPYRAVAQEQTTMELHRTPFTRGAKWFVSRLIDKMRDGDLVEVARRRFRAYNSKAAGKGIAKTTIVFPSPRDVIAADPSEAIRSEEIVAALQRDFDILEKRDWGGNLLQFLLTGIAGNFSPNDQISQELLRMLIHIEDVLLECGEFESDFAYIVARPRCGG